MNANKNSSQEDSNSILGEYPQRIPYVALCALRTKKQKHISENVGVFCVALQARHDEINTLFLLYTRSREKKTFYFFTPNAPFHFACHKQPQKPKQ